MRRVPATPGQSGGRGDEEGGGSGVVVLGGRRRQMRAKERGGEMQIFKRGVRLSCVSSFLRMVNPHPIRTSAKKKESCLCSNCKELVAFS